MKTKTLPLKGLRVPRLFILILGFLHGRFKTAALSGENHLLTSSYISGKLFLLLELCRKQALLLERDMASVRAEANAILLELSAMPPVDAKTEQTEPVQPVPQTAKNRSDAKQLRDAVRHAAQAAQDAAEAKTQKDAYQSRRAALIRRLSEIKDKITTRENTCREALNATSLALRERFSVYGHGVLLRPFTDTCLPSVDLSAPFQEYRQSHEPLMSKINTILEQEEWNHV